MDYEDFNGEDILYDTDDAYFDDYNDGYDDSYDDSYDDDYSEDDDDYSERRKGRKGRTRRAQGARGTRMNRVNTNRYGGKGTITTPAGKAKVNLPPDLVTKKELKALEAKVLANNKAILKNGQAIGVLNTNTKRLDDGLSAQNRSNEGLKKSISGIQQGQLFGALLPPKLEKVKIYGDAAIPEIPAGEAAAIDVKVKSSSFDSLTTLLPIMMSGGMSGGTGSGGNNMNMMLPMVLLLSQKDKDSDNKDDNTMLLVVMMMMMNSK